LSEEEWRQNNLDEKKRVRVKEPGWWLFVATTQPIPKGKIVCKVTRNGSFQNYSYMGPSTVPTAENFNSAEPYDRMQLCPTCSFATLRVPDNGEMLDAWEKYKSCLTGEMLVKQLHDEGHRWVEPMYRNCIARSLNPSFGKDGSELLCTVVEEDYYPVAKPKLLKVLAEIRTERNCCLRFSEKDGFVYGWRQQSGAFIQGYINLDKVSVSHQPNTGSTITTTIGRDIVENKAEEELKWGKTESLTKQDVSKKEGNIADELTALTHNLQEMKLDVKCPSNNYGPHDMKEGSDKILYCTYGCGHREKL